jgi:hypothetical protein
MTTGERDAAAAARMNASTAATAPGAGGNRALTSSRERCWPYVGEVGVESAFSRPSSSSADWSLRAKVRPRR